MYDSYRLHVASAVSWVPITAALFWLHLGGSVAVVLLLSIYANIKTDWGAAHAAKAQKEAAR
jgi:hypothetical protein